MLVSYSFKIITIFALLFQEQCYKKVIYGTGNTTKYNWTRL